MPNARRWPRRQTQVWIIVILAVGALLTVFVPPLTRHAKAERLYADAWFDVPGDELWDMSSPANTGPGHREAVRKLEAALRLDPGNSVYEQALVWHYGRARLPALIKSGKLGTKADLLAKWILVDRQVHKWKYKQPYSSMLPRPVDDAAVSRVLALLDQVAASDPSNALPRYEKAFVLGRANRPDEAFAEVEKAVRIGRVRFYLPEVDRSVRDTAHDPLHVGFFESMPEFRQMARSMANASSERLREGKVEDACRLLENGCQMGVDIAQSEPRQIISLLVGSAVFAIDQRHLEPVYKDFQMRDRVAELRRADQAFGDAADGVRKLVAAPSAYGMRLIRQQAAPVSIAVAAALAGIVLVLQALLWIVPAVRRRGRQSDLPTAPWAEGWLARMLLAVFVPLAVIFAVLAWSARPGPMEPGPSMVLITVGAAIMVLGELILIGLVLRMLHHSHDAHTGERTGILRFVFTAPAAVKAWTRKYVMAAMLGQLVFLGCCFLLTVILYKPILGAHPWQTERFKLGSLSREAAEVTRLTKDLQFARSTSMLQPSSAAETR